MKKIPPVLLLVALGGCGGGNQQAPLAGGKSPSHWLDALKSPDPQLRKTAATKLGNVGALEPRAVPALINALNDTDAAVRAEAILALVKFGPDARDAVAPLIELQQRDESEHVRGYAAKALAKLKAN
ncbi:MAG: HEAT repeat domain-containing protein [Planctomycetes bacterium]|nr:HEAT repeat domain-containing protein [Planctomycetota bacterium]